MQLHFPAGSLGCISHSRRTAAAELFALTAGIGARPLEVLPRTPPGRRFASLPLRQRSWLARPNADFCRRNSIFRVSLRTPVSKAG